MSEWDDFGEEGSLFLDLFLVALDAFLMPTLTSHKCT
jgi:hypothetical protein